jgi:hypothetical protein
MKKLILLITVLTTIGCSNESPPIEILKNNFFDKVINEMESMNCSECSGLYNFKKGQIYKSNDSIYYFVIDKVTHLPYTQDLFSFNIKSFSTILSDEKVLNVSQKNKLITEVSNSEFYEYLITKNYPNNDNLNIIDTLNQSSSEDELEEIDSWLNGSSSRKFKKDIFEFISIKMYYGDWELNVTDLTTGEPKTFILRYQDRYDPDIYETLDKIDGETPQFEILRIFEKLTFDYINNSVHSNLIKKESQPSEVFNIDFVPIKIKILHNGQSCFFVQRVKHNPLVKPKSLTFQQIKNNLNYEYNWIKYFQTEIEEKPLYSFLVGNNDYGSILWFTDKDNQKPFFRYSHKLSELKILWNELYNVDVINKPIIKNKKPDCTTIDENFIYTKMEQLKYDVVGIQSVGNRQYLVTYIKRRDMSSGNLYLDYSNQPCY